MYDFDCEGPGMVVKTNCKESPSIYVSFIILFCVWYNLNYIVHVTNVFYTPLRLNLTDSKQQ